MDAEIVAVLRECGPLPAGTLSHEVAVRLGVERRSVKSRVWQMVDEMQLRWTLDRRIVLEGGLEWLRA